MTILKEIELELKAFIIRNAYDKICKTTPEDLAGYLAECMDTFLMLQLQGEENLDNNDD
tara:strand:- start:14 stop:190 length:177 start_codon:yes stop_codon:yes gene_type:complete